MKLLCPPVSLTEALSGKRIRVSRFERGSALCALTRTQPPVALAAPQPILGYFSPRPGALSVYVAGPMPAGLRSAVEEQATGREVLLRPLPAGIQEIDLSDCRREYRVLLPPHAQQAA